MPEVQKNIDLKTVASFGDEWAHFDQSNLSDAEHTGIFTQYFGIFPWSKLPANAEGFDMGCGSGRWAKLVAPRVAKLNCIDPSAAALAVATRNLADQNNANLILAGVDEKPLAANSQDFGYSLGVLHHIPDTRAALECCVAMLKPGAPFLLYLYYDFDNRPAWFRVVWKISEIGRFVISKLPSWAKFLTTDVIAALVYWPIARLCWVFELLNIKSENIPLYAYRNKSFYTMRTDSRDRFGTPLEQRFSRAEIQHMMESAGLVDVEFSDVEPFWCAVGTKQSF